MQKPPFNLSNNYYSYSTVESDITLKGGSYYVFFQYDGKSIVKLDNEEVIIQEKSYIEFIQNNSISITVLSGFGMLLTNKIINKSIRENYTNIGNLTNNTYRVNKPWGCEYWLTGEKPVNDIVLKYIKIKKGTKTSLQVHQDKYESNFIVSGTAALRIGLEKYSSRKEYKLNEFVIMEPTVIDISPKTIHQVEALSDIDLIEASTNHLNDVIRLKDDTGRGDGKIHSEHNYK